MSAEDGYKEFFAKYGDPLDDPHFLKNIVRARKEQDDKADNDVSDEHKAVFDDAAYVLGQIRRQNGLDFMLVRVMPVVKGVFSMSSFAGTLVELDIEDKENGFSLKRKFNHDGQIRHGFRFQIGRDHKTNDLFVRPLTGLSHTNEYFLGKDERLVFDKAEGRAQFYKKMMLALVNANRERELLRRNRDYVLQAMRENADGDHDTVRASSAAAKPKPLKFN